MPLWVYRYPSNADYAMPQPLQTFSKPEPLPFWMRAMEFGVAVAVSASGQFSKPFTLICVVVNAKNVSTPKRRAATRLRALQK